MGEPFLFPLVSTAFTLSLGPYSLRLYGGATCVDTFRVLIISALKPEHDIDILWMLYDYYYLCVYIDEVVNTQ